MKNTKRITQDQQNNIHIQLDEVIQEAIKEAIVNNKYHDIYFNYETLEIFSLFTIGEEKLIGENIHMITSIEYEMLQMLSDAEEENYWKVERDNYREEHNYRKEVEDSLELQTNIWSEDLINLYELHEDLERILNINEEEVN